MYEIHMVDGINVVEDPYRAGNFIREDIFVRQFIIKCHAKICRDQDDPRYGRYWSSSTKTLGHCSLIEQAILLAQDEIKVLAPPEGAHDIQIQRVTIMDHSRQTVLTGKVVAREIQWNRPVQTPQEEAAIQAEIALLDARWYEELYADNHGTMRDLSERVSNLQGALISEIWKTHAIAALAATQ